jgi:hypothetical protein
MGPADDNQKSRPDLVPTVRRTLFNLHTHLGGAWQSRGART